MPTGTAAHWPTWCFRSSFSFSARLCHSRSAAESNRGHQRWRLYVRIARRATWLIALGLVLNLVAVFPSVTSLRIPGVLQRIGVVYLLTAPIVMHVRPTWRGALVAILVLGYWAPSATGAIRRCGCGWARAFAQSGRLHRSGRIRTPYPDSDRRSRRPARNHSLRSVPPFSARLPATGCAGTSPVSTRVGGLIAGGLVCLILGVVWSFALPLNKALWTGSFVSVHGQEWRS